MTTANDLLIKRIQSLESQVNYLLNLQRPLASAGNGWISIAASATRTGSYTFTVSGVDLTGYFKPFLPIRFLDTTLKYGYILSSVYSAGVTTVTLVANTSYLIVGATISSVDISFGNPPDFPGAFSYTANIVGFLTNPAYLAIFNVIGGRLCYLNFWSMTAGVSNSASFTVSAPIPCSAVGEISGTVSVWTGTTNANKPVCCAILSGGSTINIYQHGGGWSTSGAKFANFGIVYPIHS